jgi:hypothetical protein
VKTRSTERASKGQTDLFLLIIKYIEVNIGFANQTVFSLNLQMQNQLSGKKVSSSKGSKRPAKSGSKSQSIQMVVHTYAGSITENNQTHQEDNLTVAEQSEKILKTTSPCASMEHTSKEELSEKHGGTHIQDRPSKKKPLTTNEIQNSDQGELANLSYISPLVHSLYMFS